MQSERQITVEEKVMQGKPYAGNPHVRFDEGAGAPKHSGPLFCTMKQNRREFIKAASCMGAVSMFSDVRAAGKSNAGKTGGSMLGYAAPPIPKVRIAYLGMAFRIRMLSMLPGVEVTAICGETQDEIAAILKKLENKKGLSSKPKEYVGSDAVKRLVKDHVADVLCIDSQLNVINPALQALSGGMHVFSLLPARCSVDDCWKLVNASEKNRAHCAILDGYCIYNQYDLLAFNAVRQGCLGDLVSCEGEYFYDQRNGFASNLDDWIGMLKARMSTCGNSVPFCFGTMCRCLGINHGDQLGSLVSMSSDNISLAAYAKSHGKGTPLENMKVERGDENTTIIRTQKGRLMTLRFGITVPRPFSRMTGFSGTKGTLLVNDNSKAGISLCCDKEGSRFQFANENEIKAFKEKYSHPLCKNGAEYVRRLGVHGSADCVSIVSLFYALRFGLPLGTDVYDFATWSSLVELTDKSVRLGGAPVKCVDFTRGGWKTAQPVPVEDIDVEKFFRV